MSRLILHGDLLQVITSIIDTGCPLYKRSKATCTSHTWLRTQNKQHLRDSKYFYSSSYYLQTSLISILSLWTWSLYSEFLSFLQYALHGVQLRSFFLVLHWSRMTQPHVQVLAGGCAAVPNSVGRHTQQVSACDGPEKVSNKVFLSLSILSSTYTIDISLKSVHIT